MNVETREIVTAALAGLNARLEEHADHGWKQHGACVYCAECDVRLFQGQLPKDHPNWRHPDWRNDRR